MIEEIKIGQIWQKNYAENQSVKVAILQVNEAHVVSIVIESDLNNRPVGQILRMCLCGQDAFDRKLNAFGWIPQDDKPIDYAGHALHLIGCPDRKI